jgi:hypothetical protein
VRDSLERSGEGINLPTLGLPEPAGFEVTDLQTFVLVSVAFRSARCDRVGSDLPSSGPVWDIPRPLPVRRAADVRPISGGRVLSFKHRGATRCFREVDGWYGASRIAA